MSGQNELIRTIQRKTCYAFVIALCLFPINVTPAASPLRIGSDNQLFIGPFDDRGRDTYLVESMTNVEMTMNSARR